MKILGLDVGATNVVACCLAEFPQTSLKRFFDANKHTMKQFFPTREGITQLLAQSPDIVVMEPTGVHYSEFWHKAFTRHGISVRWVGHVQIRNYRKSNLLPDKNDRADALALACYCWQHIDEPEFFLGFNEERALTLRRLCLQLGHLDRVQNPIVNCARQYLAHEFPEVATRKSLRQSRSDVPALWGWLGQERPSPYFERLWLKSVAHDFGLTISDFTRFQAKTICALERQQGVIEEKIEKLLILPDLETYRVVFEEFGFGLRTTAVLLSHIYPFEDFLGSDLKPIIDRHQSEPGKFVKRDRSLRSFKLRLGLGLVEDSSGKSTAWVPGGSSMCRQALWQWCLTRIEPRGSRRLRSDVGQELGTYIDGLKAGGTPAKVAQLRCCSRAVVRLFKKLCQVLE